MTDAEEERFERFEEMLRRLDERLGSIERSMIALSERCPLHHEMTTSHHLAIFGRPDENRSGLIHRVASMETSIDLFRVGIKALWGVIATVVAGLILTIASQFLGHKP